MGTMSTIKVVINNRNRLSTTKTMVEHLLFLNTNEQIIIIDNGSTYPPLLKWYDSIKNKVDIRFHKNEGHLALWNTKLDKELGEYFIYTDSDIELNPLMPTNYKEIMLEMLLKHSVDKSALAIALDDLPDHYKYKHQVLRNEACWWLNEIEDDVFTADTDTTFFMMRNTGDNTFKSIRLARKDLICRHIPFYCDLENLDEEEQYYLENHDTHFITQYTIQHKLKENFNDV
jgi:glycosyltransferase involved in cell wall biosynthesis